MSRLWSLLLGLLVVILQITLANLIAIFNVKPDLVIIFVAVIALFEGSTAGVIWGFGLGLLLDAMGGGLMGLGSLGYSVAGFISGRFAAGKTTNRLHYLLALAFSTIAAHAVFLYFSQPWREVGLLQPLLERFIPGLIYTWALGLIWMVSPFSHFPGDKIRG